MQSLSDVAHGKLIKTSGSNASGKYSNDLLLDQTLAQRQSRRTDDQTAQQRPGKADEDYKRFVAGVVEKEPEELGYNIRVWTIDRLRLHLSIETVI